MKILLTSTIALGTLCLCDITHPAQATVSNDPNIHLAHVGGGYRGRGGEFQRGENYGKGDRGAQSKGNNTDSAASPSDTKQPTAPQQRVQTLNKQEKANQIPKNKAGWRGIDDGLDAGDGVVEGDCFTDPKTGVLTCD